MTNPKFSGKNNTKSTNYEVRQALSSRILQETVENPATRAKIISEINMIPEKTARKIAEYRRLYGKSPENLAKVRYGMDYNKYKTAIKYPNSAGARQDITKFKQHVSDFEQEIANAAESKPVKAELRNTMLYAPLSQQKNFDTAYLDTVRNGLGNTPEGRLEFQKFRSLYNQMMMPVLVRKIFPVGLIGLFCLLMVMLMISTEDSYLYNSAVGLVQDIILPLFKGHLSSEKHIFYLRLVSILVAVYFFFVALLFSQMDYIIMFTTIMCALWLGGAGPIMVFGLYSRFGNLTGAWCAIIMGSGHSLFGLIMQRNWALRIYPFLEKMGWVEGLNSFLKAVSSPFYPWINWSMDPVKYPINSYEIFFISMILGVGGYIIGSLLTYKPYDLDKLLHRGKYAEGAEPIKEAWTLRNVFKKLIGITPEYSRGDRFIAYLVFFYSLGYSLLLLFVVTIIWNAVSPWPDHWWSIRYFITVFIVTIITSLGSTVWFLIGGIRDMRQLFIDLENRVADENDNGQVLKKQK